MPNGRAQPRTSGRSQPVAENDNISKLIGDLVPDHLQGTDRFLDIINWNIRYFNARDSKRVELIAAIMAELNADIFILNEIEEGALEPVAELLGERGAGYYKTAYGTTGGDQRVAFMYDVDWVRASTTPRELFQGEVILGASSGKNAMPRLPLHSTFSCRAESEPFDFHLVGVHLKSQRGDGSDQREAAAKRLAKWITQETWDTDAIIAGDWNAPPNREEWAAIRRLEDGQKLRFAAWNDDAPSHFMKSGRGSKLDLVVVTESAAEAAVGGGAKVIPWKDVETQHLLVEAIDKISDHRPVLSRFYFSKE